MAYVPTNEKGDIITEEGYALAPFLVRLASAATDMAFLIAGFWLIFFFSYACEWYPTLREGMGIAETAQKIVDYQRASQLVVIREDGTMSDITADRYEPYEKAIHDFYFVYNAPNNPDNPSPHGYTVAEYNTAVYGLPKDVTIRNDSQFYDFAADDKGDPINTVLGVLKPSLFDENGQLKAESRTALLNYYKAKYYATQDILLAEPYYKAATDQIFYCMVLIEGVSIMVPFLVFYVLLPSFSPYNATLGKRFFHLAVIDVKGEPMKKWMITLRSLPFVFTAVIAIFLNEAVFSIGLAVLVFLVSWGCASFTKKKRALHDYCAHSVVIREDELYLPMNKPAKEEGDHD